MDNGGEFTDRLLNDIGIVLGQSALDVGCGAGDVSFRLAKLVGPTGLVIGIDTNPAAIEVARERAVQSRLGNITFVRASLFDASTVLEMSGFDIVACRRVLM